MTQINRDFMSSSSKEAAPLRVGIAPVKPHPLKAAFESTLFEVYGASGPMGEGELVIALRVGLRAEECTRWLQSLGATSAVIITAWNPMGRRQEPDLNRQGNQRLKAHVDALGLTRLPARCVSDADDWTEECFCVLDAPSDTLEAWMVDFAQSAAVAVRSGETPRLVWHPVHRHG